METSELVGTICAGAMAAGLVVGFWYGRKRNGTWPKVQRELGLHERNRRLAEIREGGVEGVIEDFEVRAIEQVWEIPGANDTTITKKALDVTVLGDLPDLDNDLARTLANAPAHWRFSARTWHSPSDRSSPRIGRERILEGLVLARALRAAEDIPSRLFVILADPAASVHHEVALRHLLGEPAHQARALTVADQDPTGRLSLVAARTLGELDRVGRLAAGSSPSADEAFDWLVTEHPDATATAASVHARIARQSSLTPAQLRSLVAGIRRAASPERGSSGGSRITPDGEDALIAWIDHRDEEVGLMALEALRDVGTPKALPALERAAQKGGTRGHIARAALEIRAGR